jgi:hypothetical protein
MKANQASPLRAIDRQAMGLAAIDPATIHNPLTLGKMDTTMGASHHFFWSGIPPCRGIESLVSLALGPHPPDGSKKRKQKQIFHRSPRKQNILAEKIISRNWLRIAS